ncbi:MAG: tyrosine-type recombinase/integrase, partial [Meiothermus sp.]|nr:tyrosine-type recombinase/integrase [Meiothermus sp.]
MEMSKAVELMFTYLKSQGAKPGTLRHYRHTTRIFQDFCRAQGLARVGDINHHHVRAYWAWLAERGYALGGYVRDTKRLFSFLVADEILPANPVAKAGSPRIREKEIKPLPAGLIEELLKAAGQGRNPLRDRALIVLMLDTGARVSELLGVRMGQVDPATRAIRVMGKGDRPRTVFYSYRSARFLNAYLAKERTALPGVESL